MLDYSCQIILIQELVCRLEQFSHPGSTNPIWAGNFGFHKTIVLNPVFRCHNTNIIRLVTQPILNTKLR